MNERILRIEDHKGRNRPENRVTYVPELMSRALYTSPMPPTPIWAAISYGPRRVPGVRAKLLEYKG